MSEYGTYIVPNCYDDLVTLGGTQNFDFWNRTIDPFDSESILQRCARILPRIKSNAGRLQVWTGLRPYRFKVRVECDAADVKVNVDNTTQRRETMRLGDGFDCKILPIGFLCHELNQQIIFSE